VYTSINADHPFAHVTLLHYSDDTESQDGYVGQSSNLLCAPGSGELELGHVSCWTSDDGEVVVNRFRPALSIRKGQGRALKRLVINVCASHSAFDPKYVLDLPVDEVWTNGLEGLGESQWTF